MTAPFLIEISAMTPKAGARLQEPPWILSPEPPYTPINDDHIANNTPKLLYQSYNMAPNMSLFAVQAILILSTEDGSRIFAKYYNAPHHTAAHGQCKLSQLQRYTSKNIPKYFL